MVAEGVVGGALPVGVVALVNVRAQVQLMIDALSWAENGLKSCVDELLEFREGDHNSTGVLTAERALEKIAEFRKANK